MEAGREPLALHSAQILRASCLEIKEKLLGKMWHNCQRQYQSRHSAGDCVQAADHQRARLITLVMITGDITAVSAQTPIKYEWLSSRRGSRRLWKEFESETLFWVWFLDEGEEGVETSSTRSLTREWEVYDMSGFWVYECCVKLSWRRNQAVCMHIYLYVYIQIDIHVQTHSPNVVFLSNELSLMRGNSY